jgi:hypothetical protein
MRPSWLELASSCAGQYWKCGHWYPELTALGVPLRCEAYVPSGFEKFSSYFRILFWPAMLYFWAGVLLFRSELRHDILGSQ